MDGGGTQAKKIINTQLLNSVLFIMCIILNILNLYTWILEPLATLEA